MFIPWKLWEILSGILKMIHFCRFLCISCFWTLQIAFVVHNTPHGTYIKVTIFIWGWCQATCSKLRCQMGEFRLCFPNIPNFWPVVYVIDFYNLVNGYQNINTMQTQMHKLWSEKKLNVVLGITDTILQFYLVCTRRAHLYHRNSIGTHMLMVIFVFSMRGYRCGWYLIM